MATRRTQYQIVGRYMDGSEVTGYHLQSIESGKSGRYTKEQVCFLVGRDQVTNCSGQIYKDKVLLRGNGMSLEDLPVQYEDGGSRNMEQLGKIRRGTTAEQAMSQFLIVGVIKSGRNTVGYIIKNAGSGTKKIKRQQVLELAQENKIGNARVQNYNGKLLLRGVGCNLDELPVENIEQPKEVAQVTKSASKPASKSKFAFDNDKIYIRIDTLMPKDKVYVAYLANFESGNREKLIRYCEDLMDRGIHSFSNNGLTLTEGELGPGSMFIFDDAKGGIGSYCKLAKKTGAELVIAKHMTFLDEHYQEIPEDSEEYQDMLNTIADICATEGLRRY